MAEYEDKEASSKAIKCAKTEEVNEKMERKQ